MSKKTGVIACIISLCFFSFTSQLAAKVAVDPAHQWEGADAFVKDLEKGFNALKKLPDDPTRKQAIDLGVGLMSELKIDPAVQAQTSLVKKIDTMIQEGGSGFFFGEDLKRIKKIKDLTTPNRKGQIDELIALNKKLQIKPESATDKGVYDFFYYLIGSLKKKILKKHSSKTPLAAIEKMTRAYAQLLFEANQTVRIAGARLNTKKALKAIRLLPGLMQRVGIDPRATKFTATKILNFPASLGFAIAQKQIPARIRSLQALATKVTPAPKDKDAAKTYESLFKAITALYPKKIDIQLLTPYGNLVTTTEAKFRNPALGLTKKSSFKKLAALSVDIKTGTAKAYLKLIALKKLKNVGTELSTLEIILGQVSPQFYTKYGSLVKSHLSSLASRISKDLKKRWNDSSVNRFKKVASTAAFRMSKYKKTIDGYTAKLYYYPLSDYNKGVSKISSYYKKIASKKKSIVSKNRTIAGYNAKISSYSRDPKKARTVASYRKKVLSANKSIQGYNRNIQTYGREITKLQNAMAKSALTLNNAPLTVKKKMKRIKQAR